MRGHARPPRDAICSHLVPTRVPIDGLPVALEADVPRDDRSPDAAGLWRGPRSPASASHALSRPRSWRDAGRRGDGRARGWRPAPTSTCGPDRRGRIARSSQHPRSLPSLIPQAPKVTNRFRTRIDDFRALRERTPRAGPTSAVKGRPLPLVGDVTFRRSTLDQRCAWLPERCAIRPPSGAGERSRPPGSAVAHVGRSVGQCGPGGSEVLAGPDDACRHRASAALPYARGS